MTIDRKNLFLLGFKKYLLHRKKFIIFLPPFTFSNLTRKKNFIGVFGLGKIWRKRQKNSQISFFLRVNKNKNNTGKITPIILNDPVFQILFLEKQYFINEIFRLFKAKTFLEPNNFEKTQKNA